MYEKKTPKKYFVQKISKFMFRKVKQNIKFWEGKIIFLILSKRKILSSN
jgi:hypothetical protein